MGTKIFKFYSNINNLYYFIITFTYSKFNFLITNRITEANRKKKNQQDQAAALKEQEMKARVQQQQARMQYPNNYPVSQHPHGARYPQPHPSYPHYMQKSAVHQGYPPQQQHPNFPPSHGARYPPQTSGPPTIHQPGSGQMQPQLMPNSMHYPQTPAQQHHMPSQQQHSSVGDQVNNMITSRTDASKNENPSKLRVDSPSTNPAGEQASADGKQKLTVEQQHPTIVRALQQGSNYKSPTSEQAYSPSQRSPYNPPRPYGSMPPPSPFNQYKFV